MKSREEQMKALENFLGHKLDDAGLKLAKEFGLARLTNGGFTEAQAENYLENRGDVTDGVWVHPETGKKWDLWFEMGKNGKVADIRFS